MIDDLFSGVSESAAIAHLASKQRSSLKNMVIGLFGMLMGLGLVGYFMSQPEISPDDYVSKEISVSSVRRIEADKRTQIVNDSDKTEYFLDDKIFSGHVNLETLRGQLLTPQVARIWIADSNANEIKGISVGGVYVSPEAGAAWDNSNMRSGENLGWFFFCLSAVCGIVGSMSFFYERA